MYATILEALQARCSLWFSVIFVNERLGVAFVAVAQLKIMIKIKMGVVIFPAFILN